MKRLICGSFSLLLLSAAIAPIASAQTMNPQPTDGQDPAEEPFNQEVLRESPYQPQPIEDDNELDDYNSDTTESDTMNQSDDTMNQSDESNNNPDSINSDSPASEGPGAEPFNQEVLRESPYVPDPIPDGNESSSDQSGSSEYDNEQSYSGVNQDSSANWDYFAPEDPAYRPFTQRVLRRSPYIPQPIPGDDNTISRNFNRDNYNEQPGAAQGSYNQEVLRESPDVPQSSPNVQ